MIQSRIPIVEVSPDIEAALIEAARCQHPVSGLTHNFYRYPARFSPVFVRAAIEAFSETGDTIFDPYCGGGTSLVEALAMGRHAIGVDISQLAEFVATVKTTVLEECELEDLTAWAASLADVIHLRRPSIHFADYASRGYYKHLDHPSRWRLRRAIEQALGSAITLRSARLEAFARCVILRTAQWALDGRKKLPSMVGFRKKIVEIANEMILGARDLRAAVASQASLPSIRIINRSAAGLEEEQCLASTRSPKLVVTSPPYPGIHMLYHRWQVDGRKETPAPFWIANKLDGAGSSYYTMGDRKCSELRSYFDSLRAAMSSVVHVCDKDSVIVQMVAFSDPKWQLPRYLEVMDDVGLAEIFLPSLQGDHDGRLWRSVPNRRWYANQRGETSGSQEVVLIHRTMAVDRTCPMLSKSGTRPPSEVSSAK